MDEHRFHRAIVRPPGRSFANGLTTATLGEPLLEQALAQHRAYREALERCGLTVESLPADEDFPDSTFVEDTAVLARGCAVLTRPGAPSRRGEVASVGAALGAHFEVLHEIAAPGTVDGGDVCETGRRVFIGVSERTNEAGAAALAALLRGAGHDVRRVDIRGSGLLHLKSGLTDLGEGRLLLAPELAGRVEFEGFEEVVVEGSEPYAANGVRINEVLLVAAGFPRVEALLRRLDYRVIPLEMSEFRKMDGGLSCLSLRF